MSQNDLAVLTRNEVRQLIYSGSYKTRGGRQTKKDRLLFIFRNINETHMEELLLY